MAGSIVGVDASRTSRDLVPEARKAQADRALLHDDPVLGVWVRLVDEAVQEAKRTRCGLPTDTAILARWWLEEHRPPKRDGPEYERSFAAACEWLGWNADKQRARLLTNIDRSLRRAYELHVRSVVYVRRAMVLTCAGVPTAIARQYVMPLVSEQDFRDVDAETALELSAA